MPLNKTLASMSPGIVILWASSIVVLLGLGAAAWTEPKFFDMWFWVLPLSAVGWVFVVAALGLPSIALLKLREWSAIVYLTLLTLIGAIAGGGIGVANGALAGGAVVGALIYAATALAIVKLCSMEANSTVDSDARESSARGSP